MLFILKWNFCRSTVTKEYLHVFFFIVHIILFIKEDAFSHSIRTYYIRVCIYIGPIENILELQDMIIDSIDLLG